MLAAAAIAALPITLLPQAQTLARTNTWKLIATGRDIMRCTDLFIYRRGVRGDRCYAEIAMPWEAEATPEEVQVIVEDYYP